ncbi:MAG: class IV adenylate cyclase [Nanoarchaeota archaeon]|nr:class IV adenylate cyclase [Nanoarchaeota archaeon]
MIEVEGKVKISDPAFFREKIKKLAKFKKKEIKIDDYYTLENLNHYPKKSLRIRKKGSIYEINFKQSLSFKNGIHAKDEHEFTLKSINPFLNLIKEFGFKHWLKKEKITELFEISKNFHIELNHVKELGWFLEIEYLSSKDQINSARMQVSNIIKKLGIKQNDLVKEGYTKILWNKKLYK